MIRSEKNGQDTDIVIDGFEQGIAPSPHKGLANLQGGNISTETGEILASFSRYKQTQTPIVDGTLTTTGNTGTTFTNSSTLQAGQWIHVTAVDGVTYVPTSISGISALGVGGGGAGGGNRTSGTTNSGGGGGGGEVVASSNLSVSVGAYSITIGAGGVGSSGADGGDGGVSSFGALATAAGGGGGGRDAQNGVDGASGGGGGGGTTTGGAATTGHTGGAGAAAGGSAIQTGGGGGGAGTSGAAGSATGSGFGGNGGNGTASSISGASVTYGGGGGGAGGNPDSVPAGDGGAGGTGGGGTGGNARPTAPTAGTANLGGGGGGAVGTTAAAGANGGSGIYIISYPTGLITATGGTITTSGGNTIHTFTSSGTFTVTALSSVALPTGYYFVDYYNGTNNKISFYFDPTGANPISYTHSGTLTYTTVDLSEPIAQATETYHGASTIEHRYYILDSAGLVWVYDTALYDSTLAANTVGMTWFLPDRSTSYWGGSNPSGIGVLNGWLLSFAGSTVHAKPTVNLGDTTSNTTTYRQVRFTTSSGTDDAYLMSQENTTNTHYVLVGHQGRAYWTDGNFVGSLFPETSLLTGTANVQSYASYTASNTDGTLTTVIGGSVPFLDSATRFPAVFFSSAGGSIPSALSADDVYWIDNYSGETSQFRVYAAASGGSALDIQTGATGTQYFNSFYPVGDDASAGADHATCTFQAQRVNLPFSETAQCLVEIGNTVLIGCAGTIVYAWDQVAALPFGIISLPEANTQQMVTVNQMAYIFAGNKGNIYITDGATASLVLKVPDYCAGVPGSPATYVEPTFSWGGANYIRGRVYFSILDQTSTKAGNCGGIWSFVPTQNLYIGQDTGMALRVENQNSYGTYSGVAPLIIANQVQDTNAPLFWSAWYSSVTSPSYGIDYSNTGTNASFPIIIETDAITEGTLLNNKTYSQIEYELGAPLDTGATITAQYRVNLTDAWTSVDAPFITTTSKLGGYVRVNFQQTQWLQLRFTITPITSTASTNTFVRAHQFRLR